MPPYWSRGNPIDMVGSLDFSAPSKCLEALAGCDAFDIIIASGVIGGIDLFEPLMGSTGIPEDKKKHLMMLFRERESKLEWKIMELVQKYGKPVVGVGWTMEHGKKVLSYPTPERTARVISKLVEYSKYRHGHDIT